MKQFTLFILFAISLNVGAQTKNMYTKIDPNQGFIAKLADAAKKIESIESDFTQVKYLEVFDKAVTSKGRFYFKQSDKIRLDYSSPVNYLIVINKKLKIVSEGKTTIVDLGSNQMMNQMKGMLAGCMVGDLSQISKNYTLTYFESANSYQVHIVPQQDAIKAYIAEMIITFDKTDMSVVRLRLSENATDYTEYIFTNRKYNTLTTDEKFIIR